MTTVSPYLWGTNLVTMDEQDLFLTDPTTLEYIKNIHVQMIRFPNRHHPQVYTAAARRIQQIGALPLAILPYNNLEADLRMVEELNAIFGHEQAEAFRDSFEFYCGAEAFRERIL